MKKPRHNEFKSTAQGHGCHRFWNRNIRLVSLLHIAVYVSFNYASVLFCFNTFFHSTFLRYIPLCFVKQAYLCKYLLFLHISKNRISEPSEYIFLLLVKFIKLFSTVVIFTLPPDFRILHLPQIVFNIFCQKIDFHSDMCKTVINFLNLSSWLWERRNN